LDSSSSSICHSEFFKLAGNAADHIAANAGQLGPGGSTVGKLAALVGDAGIPANLDTKEIERHAWTDA
jgi:hypothetical protein